jgi:hypothetical protein
MPSRACPHPIKTTVYSLSDTLKKLRQVGAKIDPDAYNEVVFLWRDMKDMSMDTQDLRKKGGRELASTPMSTTGARP